MSLTSEAGFPAPAAAAITRPPAAIVTAAIVTAVSVGLLVAGTLGIVGAVIVGTSLHLLGLPDDWSMVAAVATAAASLVPTAALVRRVWRIERDGPDA